MEREAYLTNLRADGDALLAAARGAMDQPVPTCPGWVGRDVVAHTGEVHRRIADRVRRGSTAADDVVHPIVPDGDGIASWYREGLDDLVDVLRATDPGKAVWNWSLVTPDTAAFWPRRMSHETAVHRVDAERAAGTPRPIDAALAADGVDEFLRIHFAEDAAGLTGGGEVVCLRTDDVPGEWTVTAGPDGATVERGARSDPRATLRGEASNLVLALWRRLALDAVEVSGDAALVDRFLATADLT